MPSNVLIVDDSRSVRMVMRRILDISGFALGDCLEAADGLEALRILMREKVDIVVTDINMPNMDGEEFMQQIASDPYLRRIPVMVLTTDRSEERMERMISLGAKGYITKPFVPETIGAALAKLVQESL